MPLGADTDWSHRTGMTTVIWATTPLRAAHMYAFALQLGAFLLYGSTLGASVWLGIKISKTTGRAWLGVLSGAVAFGAVGTLLALQGLPAPGGYGVD